MGLHYILEPGEKQKRWIHPWEDDCAAWDSGFTQTGLRVQRDVRGVQEFYSLIFGSEVNQERSFVDSTSLAIVAGYKFHSKNMTAMWVQPMRTLLNKTVLTEDNLWGLRCYALGDIKFGFTAYNVPPGLILRDTFPNPEMLWRYLVCDQLTAVNWFLDWVLISWKV